MIRARAISAPPGALLTAWPKLISRVCRRNNYNANVGSAVGNLQSAAARLRAALSDARDAVAAIDDLVEFAWRGKCQTELSKLVDELAATHAITANLLGATRDFLDDERRSIDAYRSLYAGGNVTLEDVADAIDYDGIVNAVAAGQVQLDTNLNDRAGQVKRVAACE